MATAANFYSEGDTQNYFECPICLHEFVEPLFLPCLHMYCKKCLSTYVEGLTPGSSTFSCAICRRETQLPKGGVEAFPKKVFKQNARDASFVRKCGACVLATNKNVVADATSQCTTCLEYLCAQCSPYHSRTRYTKDHKVLTFNQLSSSVHARELQQQRNIICSRHSDEQISFYCVPCEQPICGNCKSLNHYGHKYISLTDACAKRKASIQAKVDGLQKISDRKGKVIDKLNETLNYLETNKSSIRATIAQKTTSLRNAIDKRERELLEVVNQVSLEQRERVEKVCTHYQIASLSIDRTLDLAKGKIQHGSPAEVLALEQQLNKRLEDVELSSHDGNEIPKHLHLKFKTSDKSEGEMSHLLSLGMLEKEWSEMKLDLDKENAEQLDLLSSYRRSTPPSPSVNTPSVHAPRPSDNAQTPTRRPSVNAQTPTRRPSVNAQTPTPRPSINTQTPTPRPRDNVQRRYVPRLLQYAKNVLEFDISCNLPGAIAVQDGNYVVAECGRTDTSTLFVVNSHSLLDEDYETISSYNLGSMRGICGLTDGRIIVADYEKDKLLVVTANWNLANTTDIDGPCGLAVFRDSLIAVAQCDSQCITQFAFRQNRLTAESEIDLAPGPTCLAYTSEGSLVVGHTQHCRVDILNPDGSHYALYKGPSNNMGQPFDICVDRFDHIFISDAKEHAVHMLTKEGEFLRYMVTRSHGIHRPRGLAIDDDGDLVVGQVGGNVSVYQYYHK